MTETVKVRVEHVLEIPIQHDEAGRRRSLTDLVAPYIDTYFMTLQYDRKCELDVDKLVVEYGEDLGQGKMDAADTLLHNLQAKPEKVSYNEWLDSQDAECKEIYGMSAHSFYKLGWQERDSVRKDRGVKWDGQKWVRDAAG